jgi:WD40 repeat protein
MARLGSGRKKKPDELYDLLDGDRVFLDKLKTNANETYDTLREFLLSIVSGKAGEKMEIWDVKTSKKIEVMVKPSHDVRVKAAKLLKELDVDKTLSDKRDRKEDKQGDESEWLRELKKAEKKIQAGKAARKKGIKDKKVFPISKFQGGNEQ